MASSSAARPAARTTNPLPASREAADAQAPALATNDPTQAGTTPDTAESAELDRLYAESAQLEALLALARDGRVASGAAAALTSDLDAQVASIDAALIQPGIAPSERVALWQDRVDALRRSASFESTQRLLAAQGQRYDAMLVGID